MTEHEYEGLLFALGTILGYLFGVWDGLKYAKELKALKELQDFYRNRE